MTTRAIAIALLAVAGLSGPASAGPSWGGWCLLGCDVAVSPTEALAQLQRATNKEPPPDLRVAEARIGGFQDAFLRAWMRVPASRTAEVLGWLGAASSAVAEAKTGPMPGSGGEAWWPEGEVALHKGALRGYADTTIGIRPDPAQPGWVEVWIWAFQV